MTHDSIVGNAPRGASGDGFIVVGPLRLVTVKREPRRWRIRVCIVIFLVVCRFGVIEKNGRWWACYIHHDVAVALTILRMYDSSRLRSSYREEINGSQLRGTAEERERVCSRLKRRAVLL